MLEYENNPQSIEEESFRRIRALTDLGELSPDQEQVVMRVVHSTGMPEIAGQIFFSSQACEAGRTALIDGASILCDVEMVRQGITKSLVETQPLCFLNDPRVADLVSCNGETRSMAALQLWKESLAGAVVLIGNAPTALFRLLEILQQGTKKPALIVGVPVGFVGAVESKQALWNLHIELGVECITLLGRQGGSAVAAAVCNALLRCNRGQRY